MLFGVAFSPPENPGAPLSNVTRGLAGDTDISQEANVALNVERQCAFKTIKIFCVGHNSLSVFKNLSRGICILNILVWYWELYTIINVKRPGL